MRAPSGWRAGLTGQTWLALASAACFVALALVIALVPVPYVIYSPGRAYDVLGMNEGGKPFLSIGGITTYPTTGQLYMTTVSVTRDDATTSLPEALLAYWLPKRDALPRDVVYDPGKSSEQVRAEERLMMNGSQQDAVVAALLAAGQPVETLPVVATVTVSGPAHGHLQPGDLIVTVDGVTTSTPEDVREAVRARAVGDVIRLSVEREGSPVEVEVRTQASNSDPQVPVIGIEIAEGHRFAPRVQYEVSEDVGGPSAGLVFALALFDRITSEDLLRGRAVAGTGEIGPDGRIRPIGGLAEKIAGAERSGAEIFLVPAGNCPDLAGLDTSLSLIRVETLDDAIAALRYAGDPTTVDRVPRC